MKMRVLLCGFGIAMLHLASGLLEAQTDAGREPSIDSLRKQLDAQKRVSQALRLASESYKIQERFPTRSLLLAIEAVEMTRRHGEPIIPLAQQCIVDGLANVNGLPLTGHSKSVSCAAISPDGRWLVTGSRDRDVRVWDLDAKDPGNSERVLKGHTDDILCLAISPDGRWAATGSVDRTVRLWELTAKDPAASSLVLRGQSCSVTHVVFTPDGKKLASTGRFRVENGRESPFDKRTFIWNLESQNPAAKPLVLVGHQKQLTALAISPDSRWLATASNDYDVRVWDLNSDDPLNNDMVLSGHSDRVYHVAFGGNGRWLISAGSDKKLWDLNAAKSSESAKSLIDKKEKTNSLAVSADGRWLAIGSSNGSVRLWDLQSDDPSASARLMTNHGRYPNVVFSPDGQRLAAKAGRKTRIWTLKSGEFKLSGEIQGTMYPIVIDPKNRWLVAGSYNNTIRLFPLESVANSSAAINLTGHKKPVSALAATPDGRWILSASLDKTARLWDLQADPSKPVTVLRGHKRKICSVAISADGTRAATSSYDGTIRIWDLASKQSIVLHGERSGEVTWPFNVIAMSPNGRWLISGDIRMSARLWDLDAKNPQSAWRPLERRGSGGPNFESTRELSWGRISPDGRWAITGSGDKTARLWDLHAKKPADNHFELKGHTGRIDEIAFSRDGSWAVTGSWDKTARIWNLNSNDPSASSRVLKGHDSYVHAVAITPDKRWVITGSQNDIRLWDLEAEDPKAKPIILRGHTSYISDMVIRRDGRWMATSSQDQTVRLWDLQAPSVQASSLVIPQPSPLIVMDFTPDNRRLMVGSNDGVIRLWDLEIRPLLERARRQVARKLTAAEKAQYGVK